MTLDQILRELQIALAVILGRSPRSGSSAWPGSRPSCRFR
jgi:hypothetical protein